jgi:hypothetical protein
LKKEVVKAIQAAVTDIINKLPKAADVYNQVTDGVTAAARGAFTGAAFGGIAGR